MNLKFRAKQIITSENDQLWYGRFRDCRLSLYLVKNKEKREIIN